LEKITTESIQDILEYEKEIEEIQRKIKNNDYNQLKEVHHDKMVLETRRLVLENKIRSKQMFDECFKTIKNNYDELKHQNILLIEILKEVCKNKEISPGLQEKLQKLTE
jgi:hypothetical protein